jgi:NADPH:quinone reductase-like Zn-dependent oxidoreductase
MTNSLPTSSVQLRSLVTEQGTLELSLVDVPIPFLKADELLVRVEAVNGNASQRLAKPLRSN